MADPRKLTITLTNTATVTVTAASEDYGVPEMQKQIMQIIRAGGVFADDGAFYPAPFLKIVVE